MTTIVVGIEDSFRAADAVALVRDLAHATEPEILARVEGSLGHLTLNRPRALKITVARVDRWATSSDA